MSGFDDLQYILQSAELRNRNIITRREVWLHIVEDTTSRVHEFQMMLQVVQPA